MTAYDHTSVARVFLTDRKWTPPTFADLWRSSWTVQVDHGWRRGRTRPAAWTSTCSRWWPSQTGWSTAGARAPRPDHTSDDQERWLVDPPRRISVFCQTEHRRSASPSSRTPLQRQDVRDDVTVTSGNDRRWRHSVNLIELLTLRRGKRRGKISEVGSYGATFLLLWSDIPV